MSDLDNILLDMLAADAAGVDRNLIKADAFHEIAMNAERDILGLADDLFNSTGYVGSSNHVTHEMITQLSLRAAETNALLRAILTALTAGKPAETIEFDVGEGIKALSEWAEAQEKEDNQAVYTG